MPDKNILDGVLEAVRQLTETVNKNSSDIRLAVAQQSATVAQMQSDQQTNAKIQSDILNELRDIKTALSSLDSRVRDLENREHPATAPASTDTSAYGMYASSIAEFPPLVTANHATGVLSDLQSESAQRKRKTTNIVVKGLPENVNGEGCLGMNDRAVNDRKRNYDLCQLSNILHAEGFDSNPNSISVFRMGSPGTAPRLLKIKLADIRAKDYLLSFRGRSCLAQTYQNQLNLPSFPKLIVRHDLTANQRALQTAAYQVLQQVKVKHSNKQLFIGFPSSVGNPEIFEKVTDRGRTKTNHFLSPFAYSTVTEYALDLKSVFNTTSTR